MSASSDTLTLLIIDANDFSRAGLRTLLSEDACFAVVADTAINDLSLAQRLKPRLIVVDPAINSELDFSFLAELVAAVPKGAVCVRTSVSRPEAVFRAIAAGAVGYFLKADGDCTFLREALRLIGRYGAAVTGPNLVEMFQEQVRDRSVRLMVTGPDSQGLPDRACAVLGLLARGLTRDQIAAAVGVSSRTVDRTIEYLFQRFAVHSTPELVADALRHGLVD